MPPAKNFVCTLSANQIRDLAVIIEGKGWEITDGPYMHFKAAGDGVGISAYTSGKVTIQGKNAADFVAFTLEPEILHNTSLTYPAETRAAAETSAAIDPHGGVDESGKGDFFGPLAIAGVYVDAKTGPELAKIGVCDSKLIKSSQKIFDLAPKIRQIVNGKFSTVTIGPEAYNRLYRQVGNLNRLLAWGHARIIENLLEKVPGCPRMLSDKFGSEHLIQRALMTRGKTIKLDQETKAERDIAVAAASILAREQFLRGMDKLKNDLKVELPKGAGEQVLKTGRELFAQYGAEIFHRCAKTHFKTYNILTGIPIDEKH